MGERWMTVMAATMRDLEKLMKCLDEWAIVETPGDFRETYKYNTEDKCWTGTVEIKVRETVSRSTEEQQ